MLLKTSVGPTFEYNAAKVPEGINIQLKDDSDRFQEGETSVGEIAKQLAKRFKIIYAAGFACLMSWQPTLLMAITPESALGTIVAKPPHGSCIPSLVASALVCLLIAASGRRGFVFIKKNIHPLPLGIASALIGGVSILPLVTNNAVTVSASWGVAFAGILVVVAYLLWMRVFSLLSTQDLFLTLAFAQVLTSMLNAFLLLVNTYTVVLTAALLPLVSLTCLEVGTRRYIKGEDRQKRTQEIKKTSLTPRIKVVAVLFIWGVVDHLFRGEFDSVIREEGPVFALAYHAAAFGLAIVALGAACMLIALKDRFQFGHLYRAIFLIGLTSILLVPLAMSDIIPVVGYICSVIMYQLIFLFMWMIVAPVFRSSPSLAPRFFGLAYGCWSLGSLGGALSSVAFTGSGSAERVQLIVFIAALAAAVGYAVIFTERDANDLVQIMPLRQRRPFKEKCLAVAKQYKLTPRETEIAILIAQGRDSAHIEQKLFLSRSTVQTHRMHVYQKLDIHNRQELLDVIEAVDESSTTNQKA